MNKISSLLLAALFFSAGFASAQSVSVMGVVKTQTNTQTNATTTVPGPYLFGAFIEGAALSESFPSASNSVVAPGGGVTALTFDFDAWFVERSFTSLTALNTSFPNGNYGIRVGTDGPFTVDLSGSPAFPAIPKVTASAGTWSNGILKLTEAEAEAGLSLTSNISDGTGFLTIEIYSNNEDVLFEVVESPEISETITADVPSGALTKGKVYTVEVEFDRSYTAVDVDELDWAALGAKAYPLFSSRTTFEIQVVGPRLEVLGNNTLIENGSLTPNSDDHTDFGAVLVSQSVRRTFTIRNSGSADLTLDAVSVTGPDASNFTVFDQPVSSLAPGGTTTFEIVFDPAVEGDLSATVSFSTNDVNHPTFEMAIGGRGMVPTVLDFETHPQNQLVLLGAPATFEALAVGDENIGYQWQKGTLSIAEAINDTLTMPVSKASDAAAYRVIADSPLAEPVTSNTAILGIVTPGTGTRVLKPGEKLTLTCTAVAPTISGVSLSYAWRREAGLLENGTQENGAIVSGQDKATLTISKVQVDDSDDYVCVVTLNTMDPLDTDPTLEHGSVSVQVVDAVPELDFGSLPSEVSVSELMGPEVQVTATNSPTSFSAKNLPTGLKLNTQTGQITGRPTTPSKKNTDGEYIPNKIAFKASNPFGTSQEAIFEMIIQPLEPSFVGTFHGVVSRDRSANFSLGGHVAVTVGKTGVISGSAVLAGQKHSVVGALNASIGNEPTAKLLVKRKPSSLGNLMLNMNIIRDGEVQGQIYDPKFEKVSGAQVLGRAEESGDVDGSAEEARFLSPGGIAVLTDGNGYIADTGNHLIRHIAQGSNVSTIAGSGVAGDSDGSGGEASFDSPEGLALDADGNLYIADTGNATIRRMSQEGLVTTYAGAAGEVGSINGNRLLARFSQPCGLCFDTAGNLYVVDRGNHTIRKITKAGLVSTLAGKSGVPGHKDATGVSALFHSPHGIVYEPVLKALFVTDTQNFVIRKVTLTGKVSTHAGTPGVQSGAEGLRANSRWFNPTGITTRGDGTLIVGDGVLCQINPSGVVAVISEPLDETAFTDNPVALAYLPQDESILSVHNTLHGVASHRGSDIEEETEYFMAEFDARRQVWSSSNLVPLQLRGSYNAAIEEGQPTSELPRGDGYARLSISKLGVASWTGKTAEGTSFTFSTFLSGNMDDETESYFVPLHGLMHKNTASLQGECFIDGASLDLGNDSTPAFDWYKIAQSLKSTDRSYKSGFAVHQRNLFGGKYVPNNIHDFLNLEGSPVTLNLDLTEGGLAEPIATTFRISAPNSVSAPSGMTLKIDTKTGIFTGSFKTGTPAVTANFTGVLMQNSASSARGGYGYFLLPLSTSKTAPFLSGRVMF